MDISQKNQMFPTPLKQHKIHKPRHNNISQSGIDL